MKTIVSSYKNGRGLDLARPGRGEEGREGEQLADLYFTVYKGKFFLLFTMKIANFRLKSCRRRMLKDPDRSCLSHPCGRHHWRLV